MRSFCLYCFVLLSILLLSCADKGTDTGESAHSFKNFLHAAIQPFESSPSKLTPAEYIAWVQEQKGITYDSVQNNQFAISLTFHPAQLEAYTAAVTNGDDPKNSFANYLAIQKEYYYCMAECAVKYESASAPIKKTELLELLKQQLRVVKNNKDTLRTIITEAFPSYVMNQPNKLLILIPSDSLSSYRITIQGSPFQLRNCQLDLSRDDIQSFPFIKL